MHLVTRNASHRSLQEADTIESLTPIAGEGHRRQDGVFIGGDTSNRISAVRIVDTLDARLSASDRNAQSDHPTIARFTGNVLTGIEDQRILLTTYTAKSVFEQPFNAR